MSDAISQDHVHVEGWALGADTWSFHRQFYARIGRPADLGEYSALIAQIRYWLAEPLSNHRFRVKLADGSLVIVSGGWKRLRGVESPGWEPPEPPAAAKPAAVPAKTAPPPPITAKAKSASTLTLGNPAAAKALAGRLQRMGVQAQVAKPPAPHSGRGKR